MRQTIHRFLGVVLHQVLLHHAQAIVVLQLLADNQNRSYLSAMLTFVIPVYNEVESLRALHQEICAVAQEHQYEFEIMLVDDGSKDGSWDLIKQLAAEDARVFLEQPEGTERGDRESLEALARDRRH